MKLTHLDELGRPRMVDVGDKPESERTATAEGAVRMSREAFEQVAAQAVAKGDVLAIAEVAGTMGGKRAGELIPLCHPLGLDLIQVEARLEPELPGVWITARGQSHRQDRGGDGSVDGGCSGMFDGVRHGKGHRPGHDYRGRAAGEQDGWNPGRLAAVRRVDGLLTKERGNAWRDPSITANRSR